jgi:hypothetical protein
VDAARDFLNLAVRHGVVAGEDYLGDRGRHAEQMIVMAMLEIPLDGRRGGIEHRNIPARTPEPPWSSALRLRDW